MTWTLFDKANFTNQPLPPERRYVLVQTAEQPEKGLPPGVAVGYLRIWSSTVFFVIPGIGGEVTHWCDCLGDEFFAPSWPGKQTGAIIACSGPCDHAACAIQRGYEQLSS